MRRQEGREVVQVVVWGDPLVCICIGVVPVPSLRVDDLARIRPAIGSLLHARHPCGDIRPEPRKVVADTNQPAPSVRRHLGRKILPSAPNEIQHRVSPVCVPLHDHIGEVWPFRSARGGEIVHVWVELVRKDLVLRPRVRATDQKKPGTVEEIECLLLCWHAVVAGRARSRDKGPSLPPACRLDRGAARQRHALTQH